MTIKNKGTKEDKQKCIATLEADIKVRQGVINTNLADFDGYQEDIYRLLDELVAHRDAMIECDETVWHNQEIIDKTRIEIDKLKGDNNNG